MIAFCACYAVALRCATALSARRLWAAIALAHLAALLAPPLLSGDVFGYIGFARLDGAARAQPLPFDRRARRPATRSTRCSAGPTSRRPTGPLFTLLHEALVPLGIAGAVWTLKALAALTSLATVALIWRSRARLGAVAAQPPSPSTASTRW